MWMIYITVAIDLTSDGLVLGAGSAVSLSLAVRVGVRTDPRRRAGGLRLGCNVSIE